MINILLAHNQKMFREGLRQIIEQAPDIEIKVEATDLKEGLKKVKENAYDVAVIDISISDGNRFEIIKKLKKVRPQLQILALSTYPEDPFALRALKEGAAGYLTKDADPSELIAAIRKVAAGEKHVTPEVLDQLVIAFDNKISPHLSLSNREYQVMCMIAKGMSVTNIAEELSLSANTIRTYRSRLLKKMKMKNNAEITFYSIKEGLVS